LVEQILDFLRQRGLEIVWDDKLAPRAANDAFLRLGADRNELRDWLSSFGSDHLLAQCNSL
jgi:hypothetical protein